eukprot:82516_1
MAIGMAHFDPISAFILDKMYPVDETAPPESLNDAQRILQIERVEYRKMHQLLIAYFGHGMAELLENPEKLKKIYRFGTMPSGEVYWMTNHKKYWEKPES